MPKKKNKNTKNLKKSKPAFDEGHFRVAIFGSARIKPGDENYQEVFELAKTIGQHHFDIVTGGGPGLMEAANAGHMAGDKGDKAHSIGITIELPFETHPNKHLEIQKHFSKFSQRLDQFMSLSNAVVITAGGIGTCLELFYTWQLTQVKHICRIPIILVGDMWAELMNWVDKYPIARGYISESDTDNICIVNNNEEAMNVIINTHKKFLEQGDSFCVNFKKYKLD